eukprot:21269-Pyramimonas_sp.AAC.1
MRGSRRKREVEEGEGEKEEHDEDEEIFGGCWRCSAVVGKPRWGHVWALFGLTPRRFGALSKNLCARAVCVTVT